MRHDRLEGMAKGWFVGDFQPVALRSVACEVAVKTYRPGDCEEAHYHAIATEVTAIIAGEARMFGRVWRTGDIITIEPGEATSFQALTDVTTVVVKLPSAPGDKYLANAEPQTPKSLAS